MTDGGIIPGFHRYRLHSNNASTVTLVEETQAKKGDIIVGLSELTKNLY